jgi:hypothetical protein
VADERRTSCVYEPKTARIERSLRSIPKPYPQLTDVFKDDVKQGTIFLPRATGGSCARANFNRCRNNPASSRRCRIADAKDVSRTIDTVYIVFSEPIDAKSVSGISIAGDATPDTTAQRIEGDPRVVALKLNGRLKPSASYRIAVTPSVRTASGKPALANKFESKFTLEAQPPFAFVTSDPADGADHVASDLKRIRLTFNAPSVQPPARRSSEKACAACRILREQARRRRTPCRKSSGSFSRMRVTRLFSPEHQVASGDALARETKLAFSTAPSPCPPNVYAESFAGERDHARRGDDR